MASKEMTDEELSAIVTGYMNDAVGYSGSQLSEDRQKALDYYMGRPFGNEIEGRSQVISTDVADTIESMLPSLLKVFTAGDEVIEFEPVGAEDEAEAKQKTDMANYVFYKENDGFLIFYTWFKDALLQKNGFVKHWWEVIDSVEKDSYQGLTDAQFQAVAANKDIKITAHTEYQSMVPVVDPASGQIAGEQPITLHDIEAQRDKVKKQVRIENIPPEEIIMTRNAKSVDDCALIGHRTRKTRSQLIEMGYKAEDLEDQGGGSMALTGEEETRWQDEGGVVGSRFDSGDETMEEIWFTEAYVRVDFDGDGIAELRQICSLGAEGYKIIKNEPFDGMIPITSITPIMMPHKLIGRSEAELTMDTQLIKSTIQRQWLDNMYLTNNSRMGAVNGQVNLDDLLTSRPGGIVRIASPNALVPIVTPQLGNQALQALEYLDTVKENRTGITKYNQGTDSNTLNKTATGINAIMGASQQRQDLIARVFAETGVKRLFRGVIELLSKHQDVAKTIRVRNEFVSIDPTQWKSETNVTINVGLGTGNKDQQLMHLMQILGIQKELFASPFASLVNPENLYNSASEVAKNSGFKNPAKFFTKPPTAEEQAKQPKQPPPPNPEMVKVQQEGQMQQQKMQQDGELQKGKVMADKQTAQMRIDADLQIASGKLELEKYNIDQNIALQRELGYAKLRLDGEKHQQGIQHQAAIAQQGAFDDE